MTQSKIAPKYIGTQFRLPLFSGCVVWLMIDRINPSGVVTGVVWTVFGVLALCSMVAPFTEDWVHPAELPTKKRGS